MWLSNAFLVIVAFVYYFHFDVCESSPEARFQSLSSNVRFNKLQRSGHFLQKHIKISCREGEKLCRLQINPNRSQKEKKRDKRCCRKNHRMCKKKAKKRCKSRKKCLIRRYRRCRKKNSRCNKRKSTNRRPGKCETPRKKNSNEKKSFSYPTTVTESSTVAPKNEKEECNHTKECKPGLCCARHQHRKICKPLIKVGQVCKKEFRQMNKRSPEMYERCPCELGLTCIATNKARHNTCQLIT